MNREETGSGHSFSRISRAYRVCTRSGFLKSDAIFARTLRSEIPTLTVKPKRERISSFMVCAAASGEG